jgi:hypothetical protein
MEYESSSLSSASGGNFSSEAAASVAVASAEVLFGVWLVTSSSSSLK